jgi:nitric oxide synthase oxygenase domain/subunit
MLTCWLRIIIVLVYLLQVLTCTPQVCQGSSMTMYNLAEKVVGDELVSRAKQFLRQFYTENKRCVSYKTALARNRFINVLLLRSDEFEDRWKDVEHDLDIRGHYDLSEQELEYAARTAWRNSPRCPGRIQWKNLKLFDCR